MSIPTELHPSSIALFLDVDGTLVEIAARPDAVRVDPQLLDRLRSVNLHSGGAVALVSGRTIADLDRLFAPLQLPCAGLHGFERRGARGSHSRRPNPTGIAMQAARRAARRAAAQYPALLVEDKRFAVALHYRSAPHLEGVVREVMGAAAAETQPELELQLGRKVAELRPRGVNKAAAVHEFLQEPPFRGRYPIYIGDDLTDESAFEQINQAGGLSIGVDIRRPSAARARLGSVQAVGQWLAQWRGRVRLEVLEFPTAPPGEPEPLFRPTA